MPGRSCPTPRHASSSKSGCNLLRNAGSAPHYQPSNFRMAYEMPRRFRVRTSTASLVGTAVLAAVFAYGGGRPVTGILWLDFDMKNIPEPKERPNGFYDYFFKGKVVEHTKQNL